MKESLLLIGPYPPPDGGTTIPFKIFCEFLKTKFSDVYNIVVVSTTSGAKTKKSFFTPKEILKFVSIVYKIIIKCIFSKKILIFGSQRFVTIIGGIVIIIMKPLGKQIYIRVNGGGYDIYYKNSGYITRYIIEKILANAEALVVETGIVENVMKKIWVKNVYKLPNYRLLKSIDISKRVYKKTEVVIIYTGIVRKQKGIEDLLRAYVELKKTLIEKKIEIKTRLDVYGPIYTSGSENIDIDQYMKIPDIKFHGQVNNQELEKAYLSSDIFVFPTYWPTEGHSGSVIEAMMYGLPVIATKWRAIPEIVKNNVNGLLCEIRDSQDLKNKMYELVINAKLRERLSKAAMATSLQFDSQNICKRFVEIYKLNKIEQNDKYS